MKGTEDMPEPQTINYDQMLKISQKFVDDAIAILNTLPYVEVNDMVKAIMESKYILPISAVNEIIQRISKYPYGLVKSFMEVVEKNQGLYFTAASTTAENKEEVVENKEDEAKEESTAADASTAEDNKN